MSPYSGWPRRERAPANLLPLGLGRQWLPMLAGLCVAVSAASGLLVAQQASTKSLGPTFQQGSPQIGPIDVEWSCEGAGESPFWDDPITLWLTAFVGTEEEYSTSFWDTWYVEGVLSGLTASLGRHDVQLTCHSYVYADWAGSAEAWDTQTLAGRVPAELLNDPQAETFSYTSPGIYLRYREYQTKDQYEFTWGFEDSVEEWFEITGTNTCNLTGVQTASTNTSNEGRFNDRLGSLTGQQVIPSCDIPELQSCHTETRQYITVAEVGFDHAVTWTCYDVLVQRGPH